MKLFSKITLLLFFILSYNVSAEEIPGTGLSVEIEEARLQGAGATLNMLRLPVTDVLTGERRFYDISFRFALTVEGDLIFDEIQQLESSQPTNFEVILPGTYSISPQRPNNSSYIISGPSDIGGGRVTFSFVNIRSTPLTNFLFTTGNAVGHPSVGDRVITDQLNNTYIYGIVGPMATFNPSSEFQTADVGDFLTGDIIGIRQIDANTISISDFTNDDSDSVIPFNNVVLRRVED